MISQDWEKFGDEVQRTVQDAIDSQDFRKLSQTISETLNTAAGSIAQNMKSWGQNQSKNSRSRAPYDAPVQDASRAKGQVSPPQYTPPLYRKPTGAKVGGIVLAAAGFTLGGIFTAILVPLLTIALLSGAMSVPKIIGFSVFGVLMAGGYVMGACGVGICGRAKRFQSYLKILGQREYCNIREFADKTHKDIKYVAKDLEKMIAGGWFLQGHLDRQRTCLITSRRMYDQYLKIEDDRQRQEAEDAQKRAQAAEADEKRSHLSPEVRRVIDAGDDYLRQIRACNDAIPGIEISDKISRIELVVDRIFDRVEQDPDSVDDIGKLMEYYLPTTIKLLKAYEELDSQPVDGENIRSSKAEIEATLDTLSAAFEKLLDNLFQNTAWDVSTDISVLQTMLTQEGLTGNEIDNSTAS